MKSVEKFTVEIRSGFDQWWRYNAALRWGAFDASGNRIGFASAESRVAEMGSNLEAPPEGLDLHRSLTLETVPCERIVLYIYVIPHTLPRDNEIGGHPPFPLQVRIRYGDRTVLVVPRGRERTSVEGDENSLIDAGYITVNRLNWFGETPLFQDFVNM